LKDLPVSETLAGKWVMATIEPAHDISQPGRRDRPRPCGRRPSPRRRSRRPTCAACPTARRPDRYEGDWKLTGAWASEAPIEADDPWGFRVGGEDSDPALCRASRSRRHGRHRRDGHRQIRGPGLRHPGSPADDVAADQKKGPYAEVLFKYDPATRSGYSLRFWRTTRSATAVVFQLYRIVDGHGTPMGEDRLTGVVKPTTTLRIRTRGNAVTVTGRQHHGRRNPRPDGNDRAQRLRRRGLLLDRLAAQRLGGAPEASAPRGSTAH
jgi:hypothetical protein